MDLDAILAGEAVDFPVDVLCHSDEQGVLHWSIPELDLSGEAGSLKQAMDDAYDAVNVYGLDDDEPDCA